MEDLKVIQRIRLKEPQGKSKNKAEGSRREATGKPWESLRNLMENYKETTRKSKVN